MNPQKQQEPQVKLGKIATKCVVCGDKAQGINFNALTCMSCKAFFRRNGRSDRQLKCSRAGSCPIDRQTRKQCRKCRLEKCFRVGLKKEWISTPEERESNCRKRLILRRLAILSPEIDEPYEDSSRILPDPDSQDTDQLDDDLIDQLLEKTFGQEADSLDSDLLDFDADSLISTDDSERKPDSNRNLDCITNLLLRPEPDEPEPDWSCIIADKSEYPSMGHELGLPPAQDLLEGEWHSIAELTTACTVLQNPYTRILDMSAYPNVGSGEVIHYTIVRMVRMCKRLRAFGGFSSDEQSSLLKRNLFHLLMVRWLLMYNPERKALQLMDDRNQVTVLVHLDRLKPALGSLLPVDIEQLTSEGLSAHHDWAFDSTIVDLLCAVALFSMRTQEIPGATDAHQFYTRLLARYLLHKYPRQAEAETHFGSLQRKLAQTHELAELMRQVYRACCQPDAETLLWELLNY